MSTGRGNRHGAILVGLFLGESCCCCAESVGEESLLMGKAGEVEDVELGGLREVAEVLERGSKG